MSENKFLSAAASENLARIQAIQEKIARTYHSPFLDTVFRTLEQPEIAHIINSPAYKQMTKNIERINKAFNPYSTPLLQSVLINFREQCEVLSTVNPQLATIIEQQQKILELLEKLNINLEAQKLSPETSKKVEVIFHSTIQTVTSYIEVHVPSHVDPAIPQEKSSSGTFMDLLGVFSFLITLYMAVHQVRTERKKDREEKEFKESLLQFIYNIHQLLQEQHLKITDSHQEKNTPVEPNASSNSPNTP